MKLLTTSEGLPRLSWGSVIAGVILSSIVYLIMSVLGTAIGASLLSPLSQPNPLHGFGFGSGAWVIITTVLPFLSAPISLAGAPPSSAGSTVCFPGLS
jgi:hypothetical protein